MSPSITYWNRLEPRPHANSIAQTLAARIRDPLWMLTRQWQCGEFQGEDAGSPAYIELTAQVASLAGWQAKNHTAQPMGNGSGVTPPLEALVTREPFSPDFTLRVEMGQVFETLLAQGEVQEFIDDFRIAYPVPLVPDRRIDVLFSVAASFQTELDLGKTVPAALQQAFQNNSITLPTASIIWVKEKGKEWMITDNESGQCYAVIQENTASFVYLLRDQEAIRFLHVCAGRAIDGVALYEAHAQSSTFTLPSSITSANQQDAVMKALYDLKDWVQEIYGEIGFADAAAWQPERLEYAVDVIGTMNAQTTNVLSAYPGHDGAFEWHAFALQQESATLAGIPPGEVEQKRMNVLPMHARFRGMPNARWWDFEVGTTDFGDVRTDKRDLGKLVMMDFMLIHGNDWFVIPFDLPVGTLCWIDALLVHDVFGETTLVKRAERMDAAGGTPAPAELWTMFSINREDKPSEITDFFLLPYSAASSLQTGQTLEEVRFLRDEMANMVWAVEYATENGIGQPWPGRERALAAKSLPSVDDGSAAGGGPQLRYQLQTSVPVNWIPFLPVVLDPAKGTFALEIGAMLDAATMPVTPVGRILQPTGLVQGQPYRVREEEVPREGTSVRRMVSRSRWVDGSTYLWMSRRKVAGLGEGSSGLRFDVAISTQ
jgi:hypothetical protein